MQTHVAFLLDLALGSAVSWKLLWERECSRISLVKFAFRSL